MWNYLGGGYMQFLFNLKYFFNKSKSLSNPAKNINRNTPNSEKRETISFGLTQPRIAGPSKIPDNSCPITAGILRRENNCPKSVVASRIKINSPKKCIFPQLSITLWQNKKLSRTC